MKIDNAHIRGLSKNHQFPGLFASLSETEAFESALDSLMEEIRIRAAGSRIWSIETLLEQFEERVVFEKARLRSEKEFVEKLKEEFKDLLKLES